MWTKKTKIYYILYIVSARWLPESRHLHLAKQLRGFFARRIAYMVGENINIERGARFTPELEMGSNSGIGINCEVYGPVSIGDNVMMGPEVVVYTQNHKHNAGELFTAQGYDEVLPVKIGNNVWIGRRAMFMPGSTVGNNAIVAAGAIVTSKFGDNVILGGVPAKVIGKI